MFFPVRKQKKKSQSNKCKILKYFRTSGSTQEYLSTQTCQVQNTREYLSTQTCEVQNTQEYLSTQKCQVQNTQEYLSTQTSKYPNTHQYLSTQKYLWLNTPYLLTWNISLSNRVWYTLSTEGIYNNNTYSTCIEICDVITLENSNTDTVREFT